MSTPWKGKKLSEEHKARIRAGVLAAQAAGADIGNKGMSKTGSGGNGVPCLPGCSCRRHDNHNPKTRGPLTPEWRAKIGAGVSKTIAENGSPFSGGAIAEDFASVLCPAGFVREYHVWFGDKIDSMGKRNGHTRLDFAHIEGKVNIELDGYTHDRPQQKQRDVERDALLASFGWKVIRIKV